MIKKIIHVFMIIVISLSLTNCVTVRPKREPPPPRKEVRTHRPGPNYFWIAGHYEWRHRHWVWTPGHWEKRRPGQVWVRGHWVKKRGRLVWVPGHWRKR